MRLGRAGNIEGPMARHTASLGLHLKSRIQPVKRQRLLAALPLCVLLAALPLPTVCAQGVTKGRSSALGAVAVPGATTQLEAPDMLLGAPASETPLAVTLAQGSPAPENSYGRIRGLDPQMTLSAGHVIAPGAWAVPLAALPGLRVVIPARASGKSMLSIALVAIDGGVVAEAKTALIVAPAALPPSEPARPAPKADMPGVAALPPAKAVEPTAPVPPAPAAPNRATPQPTPLSPAARERSEGFLARGRKLLEDGNIASARLFFRRAADEGLADGAIALGGTFDPAELAQLRAIGIRPDIAEARRWYEKARELGAEALANRRLERLGSR